MTFSMPFTTTGLTEHQKNADLAIYLLAYLGEKCDPYERVWLGEQPTRTLQFTCHSLEALNQLNLKAITEPLIDPAVDWLLALPVEHDAPPEERRSLRIYPSRFKTVALLGRFDPARVGDDFADLSQLLNEDTGFIHNAPLTLNAALITMIWVDALLHLEALDLLDPAWHGGREHALRAIAAAFDTWAGKAASAADSANPPSEVIAPGRPGEITNAGNASYALDLLIRSGRMSPHSPRAADARRMLSTAIHERSLGSMRDTDLLYCGIHLRTHFPDQADARDIVETFIAELRERYQNNESQRLPTSFHALVLRLLAAHHGERLHDAILEKLWLRNREATEAQRRQERQQLEAAFADLIRRSIHIHLSQVESISGTAARGEVYRLVFGVSTDATGERGSPFALPSNALRLIVKKGPPDMLARAGQRYRELPESLQVYFARHAGPQGEYDGAPGYLIMQDLADMQPLSEILDQLDRPVPRREEYERVAAAATAVAAALHALHGHEPRPSVVGHQFNVIYLTPIIDCVNRLCQTLAFPELKQWVDGRLQVNGWTYRKIGWYLKRLIQFESRLRPPQLGYAHGDCHSRNLMLDHDLKRAKFVDLETLSKAEDYLVDYGLLIEDVAFYRALRARGQRESFEWDAIQTSRPDNLSKTLDNWITYPPFAEHSEIERLFQRELIAHLRDYATRIGDRSWKERLWLAIVRGLFMLGARQLTSYTVEPKRRRDGLKLVQVTYAEALRLLHELVSHIQGKGKSPLPEVPFPGAHQTPPRAPQNKGGAGLVAALVKAIYDEWGEDVERRQNPDLPYFIDYLTHPARRLFARIHTKSSGPILYLACRPEQLRDSQNLAQPASEGDLKARILLNPAISVPHIVSLVRQAHRLASNAASHGAG